jgi:hypothetical protein
MDRNLSFLVLMINGNNEKLCVDRVFLDAESYSCTCTASGDASWEECAKQTNHDNGVASSPNQGCHGNGGCELEVDGRCTEKL